MQNPPIAEYLYAKASHLRIPLSGTFELWPVCNLSCKMCYVRQTREEMARSSRKGLSLEDWLHLAAEARQAGMLYLLLTGGEPFLWPHFWPLYEALVDMGFLVSINTNGTLIDDDAVARLVKKPPMRLNITLYGAEDATYAALCGSGGVYEKVDRAVSKLTAAGISVKLNCSVMPQNVGDLPQICQYAKEKGVALGVATYMFPPVRRQEGREEFQRLSPEAAARAQLCWLAHSRDEEAYLAYLRAIADGCVPPPGLDEGCVDPVDGRIRCRAGNASFWVTWDGWMLSCGLLPEPKVDLRQMDFAAAWEKLAEKCAAVRLSGVCDTCPDRKLCHPCAAVAYGETGTAAGIPRYMCSATRQLQVIAREILAEK